MNEVSVHTRSHYMMFGTVRVDTSTIDPSWRVDSIELREDRKGREGMEKGIKRIQEIK